MPAIDWIQWDEPVIAENDPSGAPDVDNRPLKQLLINSGLSINDANPAFLTTAAVVTFQPIVIDYTLNTPPLTPADGDTYVVAAGGINEWTGQDTKVARYNLALTTWYFYTPVEGWEVFSQTQNYRIRFDGSDWIPTLNYYGISIQDGEFTVNSPTNFVDITARSISLQSVGTGFEGNLTGIFSGYIDIATVKGITVADSGAFGISIGAVDDFSLASQATLSLSGDGGNSTLDLDSSLLGSSLNNITFNAYSGATIVDLQNALVNVTGAMTVSAAITGLINGQFGDTAANWALLPTLTAALFPIRSMNRIGSVRYGGGAVLRMARLNGTPAAQTAVLTGEQLGTIDFAGYNGTDVGVQSTIEAFSAENFSSTNKGTELRFSTTTIAAATRTNRWIMQAAGHFVAVLDNTYDHGNAGALRIRTYYAGTSFVGPVLDSGADVDLLLKRNAVTQLTIGNGLVTVAANLNVVTSLHVGNTDGAAAFGANELIRVEGGSIGLTTYATENGLRQRRANGAAGAETALANGNVIGRFRFAGFNGTTYVDSATIFAQTTQAYTGSVNGTQLGFQITLTGTTGLTSVAFFNGSGNFVPGADNTYSVGIAGTTWSGLFSRVVDSGSATDLLLKRNAVTQLTLGSLLATFAGDVDLASGKVYKVNAVQVVSARNTGWTAFTGASNKATAYDPSTITLVQLAERVSAMQIAFTTHGLIGA